MENEVINSLANEIIEKLKGKMDIEKEMKEFLEASLSIDSKKKVLELFYLIQLYSNAYVGPDPRGKWSLLSNAHSVLKVKSEEEFNIKLNELEVVVEILKNAEIHPIETTKRKLEDKEKYKGFIF